MNSENLDLNLLRVFEAMLHRGNVTAAAADVNLSQSAMSGALGRLRRHFDDALFVKTHNGMMPTPRALQLAEPLLKSLELVRAAVKKEDLFNPSTVRREFRVFMSDIGEMLFLPVIVEHLRSINAKLTIRTAQVSVGELELALESGKFDVAMGYFPTLVSSVRSVPLFEEHYVCMSRGKHSFAHKKRLTLKEYCSAEHLVIDPMGSGHAAVERELRSHGVKNIVLQTPHYVPMPMIVANSDLLATGPSRMAKAAMQLLDIKTYPVPFPIPSFEVKLFWHPRYENDAGNKWMRELAVQLFSKGF